MLRILILSLLFVPGLGTAADNASRLESLQIEIWPEYDRPAALVILKGELAGDVSLPVSLALRIPASSGGPAAVAYAAQKTGPLLNLRHDRSAAADFITVRFTTPERFFHVEFYDPLATGTRERSYKYLWPGDLPVDALQVIVQEPAAASDISVQPELGDRSTGTDGLRYRAAQLGPAPQGKALPIEIRYAKSDPRTSMEILKVDAPSASPPASPQAITSAEERDAFRLFLASGAFALLVAGSSLLYFLWWRRRPRPSAADAAGGNFCGKCGHALAAGDRFCSKCGTAIA
ncbi:MAG: zinc ribbon domain-containing protein [Betaproteobacteria bacterium]|nr:zinc ribbon domain-containing protein [Betaproteobacteria bacterium]